MWYKTTTSVTIDVSSECSHPPLVHVGVGQEVSWGPTAPHVHAPERVRHHPLRWGSPRRGALEGQLAVVARAWHPHRLPHRWTAPWGRGAGHVTGCPQLCGGYGGRTVDGGHSGWRDQGDIWWLYLGLLWACGFSLWGDCHIYGTNTSCILSLISYSITRLWRTEVTGIYSLDFWTMWCFDWNKPQEFT